MPSRRSFRLAAQDLEAQFLELLARFRFDQGRADDGRNPDVRDELAMIDYLCERTAIDHARGEFRRREVAADESRLHFALRRKHDFANVFEGNRQRTARGLAFLLDA